MKTRSWLFTLVVLGLGLALGYAAATGNFNTDRLTAAQPKAEEKAAQLKPAPKMATDIPPGIVTPDKVETLLGTLELKDGAPTKATVDKLYDDLGFTHAFDAFRNTFQGASAYAMRKGFLSIGVEDNSVVIFSVLMDSKSLFLTANADKLFRYIIDRFKVDLGSEPEVSLRCPLSDWLGRHLEVRCASSTMESRHRCRAFGVLLVANRG